jgi:hypothetical protein
MTVILVVYHDNRFSGTGDTISSRCNGNGSLKWIFDFLLTENKEGLAV